MNDVLNMIPTRLNVEQTTCPSALTTPKPKYLGSLKFESKYLEEYKVLQA